MKAINTGNRYEIYDDTLKTFDRLPANTYIVRFSKNSGFYLELYGNFEINEKMYGVHKSKVDKVAKAFDLFERNLGVILSGDKGIGKSLCAKMLAVEMVRRGVPVIVVDRFIPGINSYLESIEQEVMVLFDEFDKTFGDIKTAENETEAQAGMLGLFDGLSNGKKLFVITCNNLRNLSDYLINRPGRFHYHFRFDYPNAEEVTEYLEDKVLQQYKSEINKVVMFSNKINLNYDCLRAIAFELNTGIGFEDAIQDLNILNLNTQKYKLYLYFDDGTIAETKENMDLFDGRQYNVEFDVDGKFLYVAFNSEDCVFDYKNGNCIIDSENLHLDYDEKYNSAEEVKELKALKVKRLVIRKVAEKSLHYIL